jgi:hypothetical protein
MTGYVQLYLVADDMTYAKEHGRHSVKLLYRNVKCKILEEVQTGNAEQCNAEQRNAEQRNAVSYLQSNCLMCC